LTTSACFLWRRVSKAFTDPSGQLRLAHESRRARWGCGQQSTPIADMRASERRLLGEEAASDLRLTLRTPVGSRACKLAFVPNPGFIVVRGIPAPFRRGNPSLLPCTPKSLSHLWRKYSVSEVAYLTSSPHVTAHAHKCILVTITASPASIER
jgi:hypothetical protein